MAKIKTLLDDSNFIEFMVTAKRSTYASGANPLQLASGGKLYTFSHERWPQWRYTDEWYGDNPFLGRETYMERTDPYGPFAPVAHMPYDGYVKGDETQVKRIFVYLEEMLRQVDEQSLFRGPTTLTAGDEICYVCTWRRADKFRAHGNERIEFLLPSLANQEISYHLNFQFCCLR